MAVLELSSMEAQAALEQLTHATKDHPHPVMPLSEVAPGLSSMLHRAAIKTRLLALPNRSLRAFAKWQRRTIGS